jgi:hypothetical protein
MTVATGAAAAGVSNGIFTSFGNPATNASGHSAFRGVLALAPSSQSGPAITVANNVGIWADDVNGNRQLVAQVGGTNAPALVPEPFARLCDPVYNANNAVAFTGTLKNGVTGVWTNASGGGVNGNGLTVVAQSGGVAAGCPSGTTFSSFSQIALSDNGSVAMLAHTTVSAAVDSTTLNDAGDRQQRQLAADRSHRRRRERQDGDGALLPSGYALGSNRLRTVAQRRPDQRKSDLPGLLQRSDHGNHECGLPVGGEESQILELKENRSSGAKQDRCFPRTEKLPTKFDVTTRRA